jgi:hypothetical protein
MTFCYMASFDFTDRRHGFGSVTFTRSGGATFTLDLRTDVSNGVNSDGDSIRVSNHYTSGLTDAVAEDSEGSTGLRHTAATQSWSSLFQLRMRQAAAGAGWASSSSLTCTFDMTNLRYTFGYSANFTAITFSTTATARLFGFASSFSGSASSVVGLLTPSFIIEPVLSAVTMEGQDGYNYEPTGISQQSVTDFGSVFGQTRACVPLFRDWVQQGETRTKAIRTSALQTSFTHQDLFTTCRNVHPFVVIDGFGDGRDYVFRLRPDTCMFSNNVIRRAGGEMDDALFDIAYSAQLLGVFDDGSDEDEFSGQLVINGFPVTINEDNNVVING